MKNIVPKIALVVLSDGRIDYLNETLTTFWEHCEDYFDQKIMVNDAGESSSNYYINHYKNGAGAKLTGRGGFDIHFMSGKSGLARAVQKAWSVIDPEMDYIFHLEEDFRFVRDIYPQNMIQIMEENPWLTQMALMRQPWNTNEINAGGIMNLNPDSYEPHKTDYHYWCSHRNFFTLNPCIIPKRIYSAGWPDGNEAQMIKTLNENPENKSGYWGPKFDAPWVYHIGVNRSIGWKE